MRTGIGVYDIKGSAGKRHGSLGVCGQVCGGYAEGGGMHKGRYRIDVHGSVLVGRGHMDVWVVFGKVVRVGVVLGVLRYWGGGCIEVIVTEDPNKTPVAGRADDAACGVADHASRVKGLVGGCGGGKEHALGVVVAVEAMEKGKEDRVGGVCGEMLEMHACKLGGVEEGKLARMS